jgi:hypothetical protein
VYIGHASTEQEPMLPILLEVDVRWAHMPSQRGGDLWCLRSSRGAATTAQTAQALGRLRHG